jgi:hypothetical protein
LLVLCIATTALWILSFRMSNAFTRAESPTMVESLGASRGDAAVVWIGLGTPTMPSEVHWTYRSGPPQDIGTGLTGKPTTDLRFAGAAYLVGEEHFFGATFSYHFLIVPLWQLVLLFTILPAVRFFNWRRRRLLAHRLRAGLCPNCGYDMRATPDQCPECGRSVPTALIRNSSA